MIKNILIVFLILISVTSCANNSKQAPKAAKGVIDLRNWDFEKDGIVKLDGEWEFYWQQFLKSKNFDTIIKRQIIQIPSSWKDYRWHGKKLTYYGYCSYRLKILMPDSSQHFALKSPAQGTAYRLFFNDSLLGENGKVGINELNSEPQYNPQIIEVERFNDTNYIVLWISNFDYWKGGMWYALELGKEESIRTKTEKNISIEYFTAGALFLFTFILFCFYYYRPKEKTSLYFGILCLLGMTRVISTSELIITKIFPNIDWELLIKLEFCSFYLLAPIFWLYMYSLFPHDVNKRIPKVLLFIALAASFFAIILSAKIHSHYLLLLQIVFLFSGISTMYIFIIAKLRNRDGALAFGIGFLFVIIASITEILYHNNITNSYIPVPFGIIILFFSQAVLLSKKFSGALNKVENFAKELKTLVDERTKELMHEKEKTEELLLKSDKLLLNVLPEQIANRLKSGETTIADHFEEASVIFIDIADFTKMSAKSTPQKMVNMLNEIFSIFDKISAKYGLEKIKTIGDCYMAAAGIPVPREDHAHAIAKMALEVMETMKVYSYSSDDFKSSDESCIINFRIGLDCGPIVAGVIGEQKFIYDLWGDMVNTASRMETNGIIGKIQCTERFKKKIEEIPLNSPLSKGESGAGGLLPLSKGVSAAEGFLQLSNVESSELPSLEKRGQGGFFFTERGEIEIKGKGMMRTYFLEKING